MHLWGIFFLIALAYYFRSDLSHRGIFDPDPTSRGALLPFREAFTSEFFFP